MWRKKKAAFKLSGAGLLFVPCKCLTFFLCTTLVSPSSAAPGQEQKSLCIKREREEGGDGEVGEVGGVAGHRVAKATRNSAGMVVKEEEVWADRDNWRRQGTPLCIKILHTSF